MIEYRRMKIIGVNTSTKRGSVALLEDTDVIDEEESEKPESFSRSILGMLDRILTRNGTSLEELDGIGVAAGPGSFTGIRIGQATIAGISLSTGIPLYGVSTLEAMATVMAGTLTQRAGKNGIVRLVPMLDAGRGNSYYAVFSARSARNSLERITEDRLAPAEEVAKEAGDGLFFGEGAEKYKDMLKGTGCEVEVMGGGKPLSIAVGAAILGSKAAVDGSKGDIFCLKPNYIHGGPAINIQQPN
jgi:tRNA threonylcarbamoyladenosine biosynthesis protein TsaB